MKEDIKILEKYLKYIKNFDNNSDFIPALEHLITGYKELEKQLNLEIEGRSLLLTSLENNYIPNQKVKEKIEEINDETDLINKEYFIEILQELLEGDK